MAASVEEAFIAATFSEAWNVGKNFVADMT